MLLTVVMGLGNDLRPDELAAENAAAPRGIESVGTALQGVFARGRIEPRGQVRSVAPAGSTGGSTVVELYVKVGDAVKQGDILAVLDRADYLAGACRVAEERQREAEVRLDLERLAVRSALQERQAAAASVEARLELAHLKLERRLTMSERATTKESVDDARLEVRSAEAALQEARSRLLRYATPEDGLQLDVLARTSAVQVAKSELALAQEEQEAAYVRAPMDGVILEVLVREGESVSAGTIVDLADTAQMFARMEVYETDATRLALGGRAEVTSPALTGALDGRIVWISERVRQQSVVDATPAANTDARVIEVLVELDAGSSNKARSLIDLQVRTRFLP